MRQRTFPGSRLSLVFLILIALLPVLGLLLYNGYEQRRLAGLEAQLDALQLTQLTSMEYERLVDGARQLLVTLARADSLQKKDGPACGTLLADLHEQFPQYTNLGMVDISGDIICQAVPLADPVDVSGLSWFQQAVQRKEFASGDYQVSPATGKPIVVFGYPVLDPQGNLTGVVSAALDLTSLIQPTQADQLPHGAAISLIDRSGNVLVRYPDPDRISGTSIANTQLFTELQSRPAGTAEAEWLNGVPRLVGFVHLRGAEGIAVAVSIPTEVAYAEANRILELNLLWFVLISLATLGLAWVLSYRYFHAAGQQPGADHS